MSGNVIQMPSRGETRTLLTKQQLATRIGRSTRWIEIQMRTKGLPAEPTTDRMGRRRYDLAAVEVWLESGKPLERPASDHERIVALEQTVASLEAQLNDLRRAG